MAVKLRFMKAGRRNLPFFRLVATDNRFPRDGKSIEILGYYDPLVEDKEKQFVVKEDRVKHWLALGARPSETVGQLLAKKSITFAEPKERDRSGRKKSRAARKTKLQAKKKSPRKKARKVARKKRAEAKLAAAKAASAESTPAAETKEEAAS